jgi:hypothetical protein
LQDLRGGIGFRLLVFLAVVFAFAALGWMLFLPSVLTAQFRARTGFDAVVGQFTANPLTGRVIVKGLVVTNPPTFPTSDFLDLREFRAQLSLWSLFSDHLIVESIKIDVASLTLVARHDGRTNARALQENWHRFRGGPALPPSSRGAKLPEIRQLDLHFDRLVLVDYRGRQPATHEFDLQIDQRYENVRGITQLFSPSTLGHLAPAAVAAAGMLPREIGATLGEAGRAEMETVRGKPAAGPETGYFDALEESKKP